MLRESLGPAVDRTPGAQPSGNSSTGASTTTRRSGRASRREPAAAAARPPASAARASTGSASDPPPSAGHPTAPGTGHEPLDRQPLDRSRDAVARRGRLARANPAHGGDAAPRVACELDAGPRDPPRGSRARATAADMPASTIEHGIPRRDQRRLRVGGQGRLAGAGQTGELDHDREAGFRAAPRWRHGYVRAPGPVAASRRARPPASWTSRSRTPRRCGCGRSRGRPRDDARPRPPGRA